MIVNPSRKPAFWAEVERLNRASKQTAKPEVAPAPEQRKAIAKAALAKAEASTPRGMAAKKEKPEPADHIPARGKKVAKPADTEEIATPHAPRAKRPSTSAKAPAAKKSKRGAGK